MKIHLCLPVYFQQKMTEMVTFQQFRTKKIAGVPSGKKMFHLQNKKCRNLQTRLGHTYPLLSVFRFVSFNTFLFLISVKVVITGGIQKPGVIDRLIGYSLCKISLISFFYFFLFIPNAFTKKSRQR